MSSVTETEATVWKTCVEAHFAVLQQLAHELRRQCGLSLAWYEVLSQLADSPSRRLRMQELATALSLSKSAITRLVDRMAVEALVERLACPSDRRSTFVAITSKGQQAFNDAQPTYIRTVKEYFLQHLSSDEILILINAFERIGQALRLHPATDEFEDSEACNSIGC